MVATDAQLARLAVRYAVRTGRLPAPSALACADCGTPAQAYHHWRGYERPQRLDVIALCDRCHVRLHYGLRNYALAPRTRGRLMTEPGRCADIPLALAAEDVRRPLAALLAAAEAGTLTARRIGPLWVTTPAAVTAWVENADHRPGPPPGAGPKRKRKEEGE